MVSACRLVTCPRFPPRNVVRSKQRSPQTPSAARSPRVRGRSCLRRDEPEHTNMMLCRSPRGVLSPDLAGNFEAVARDSLRACGSPSSSGRSDSPPCLATLKPPSTSRCGPGCPIRPRPRRSSRDRNRPVGDTRASQQMVHSLSFFWNCEGEAQRASPLAQPLHTIGTRTNCPPDATSDASGLARNVMRNARRTTGDSSAGRS